MSYELTWGIPVILYLFLAGMGAGATTVSASMLLRGGGGPRGSHLEIARYGALLGPIPVILGTALIVFELGSFEHGDYFKFFNLLLTMNLSPMNAGSWLLFLFTATSVIYAYTFLDLPTPFMDRLQWRTITAWVNIPLGIGVAIYTGVMLGAMPSRPFWNSPLLAMLFTISALSTGVALIILFRALFAHGGGEEKEAQREESGYILASADAMLIGFELLAVVLFLMYAFLTVGDVRYAVQTILPGGELASLFWIGVILVGLLLPALVETYMVAPRLLRKEDYKASRLTEIVIAAAVIFGGLALRYVVVVAGQITGPVGI